VRIYRLPFFVVTVLTSEVTCVMVQRFHRPIFFLETKPRPQKLANIIDRLTSALRYSHAFASFADNNKQLPLYVAASRKCGSTDYNAETSAQDAFFAQERHSVNHKATALLFYFLSLVVFFSFSKTVNNIFAQNLFQ